MNTNLPEDKIVRSNSFLYVENFFWNVFKEKMQKKSLNLVDFMVYCSMCRLANKLNNQCFPAISYLMNDLGKNDSTIRDSIRRLTKEKLIIKKHRVNQKGRQISNLYTILTVEEYLKIIEPNTVFGTCRDFGTSPAEISAPHINNNNINNNNNTRIHSYYYSCDFAVEFWNKYDKWKGNKIPRNKTVYKKLLPKCNKITEEIQNAWNSRKITEEDFKYALEKYLLEIANRDMSKANNGYENHRFSFFQFIKQQNGFLKFKNC